MNFDPEVIHASALPDFKDPAGAPPTLEDGAINPDFKGVAFTIHQFTEGKRLKIRLAMAETNARIRDLMVAKLDADTLPEAERPAVLAGVVADLQELIEDRINPAWVRNLLVGIHGLTIKGKPATPETLIESGPPALYREIVQAIRAAAGLSEQERGESKPLTTSND